ncbi:helix-turn-helix transcriptional regulator [Rhodomicrobium lacus]|uniref:helix-turn-helix transcriptional regulator n=1 Tax=Rhodomicrobium lacus TaxID=2498452 RepID=UPI000F8EFFA5|nr:helix-turn-helix transcriptional regulator [Rhodomicrobium lacus]
MNTQTIVTPSGERLVILPETDYNRLLEAVEDAADIAAGDEVLRKLSAGEEELLPSEFVDRLLAGESPLRLWREHRRLTSAALAEKAEVAQSYISEIETGKKEGGLKTMKKLADALGIGLEDLV